jgi:hypothetical protein
MTLHYKITVTEHLDDSWSDWFGGLTITHTQDGATTLAGAVRDQTALYGLIATIRDLGLTLVDVTPCSPSTSRGTENEAVTQAEHVRPKTRLDQRLNDRELKS